MMILLTDVPLEKKLRYMVDNLYPYAESPELAAVLGRLPGDAAGGLRAHHDLLRRLYSDVEPVKDFPDLVATLSFLYAVSAFGTLRANGHPELVIGKARLKTAYRKSDLSRRKAHLERHGFAIRYLTAGNEVASLATASDIGLTYAGHPDLLPALHAFAASTESIEGELRDCAYNKIGIFMKADYEAGFLRRPVRREALVPTRPDILTMMGAYRQTWLDLVAALTGQGGLACSGFFHYGESPSWSLSFAAKGKRPLAIFALGSEVVAVEFTLPVEHAEALIRARHTYAPAIREAIEGFRCGDCPKACEGANLVRIDGVWLCKGRAEARRIYRYLVTDEDFASIRAMLDIIYER
jgi:hypothetical protein